MVEQLLFAAAEGDIKELKRLHLDSEAPEGLLFASDYDDRTALHLAASEGRDKIVKYIINESKFTDENECYLSPRDRWGRTPLDDAFSGKHNQVVSRLIKAGAKRSDELGESGFR